jgi:putative transcriptional regulator
MKNGIKQELKKQGFTQADLAKRVGVKREYINRIINDKTTPTIPLGIKISAALGCIVEDIFFYVESN